MAEWSSGKNWDGEERRQENSKIVQMLSSMDKNIALLTQSSQAHLEAFKEHLKDDEIVKAKVASIENRMAWYAGGIAVIVFIVGMLPKIVK